MPPVTNQKYVITCRHGHVDTVHWRGLCTTCHPDGAEWGDRVEPAYYLFEDGSRMICDPRYRLPPTNPCAECGEWALEWDYLCGDCRGT